jgi:chemotaxis protein CheC
VEPTIDERQRRLLTSILERGAEDASSALTKWLGRPVRLSISEVDVVDLAEATELLGAPDALVAVCAMELTGRLAGHLLLVFEDRSGLALADMLMGHPLGTASAWGELEQSAALETANIVGCAYLNSLAAHLPLHGGAVAGAALLPSPPAFRHEFAASLLEFALMEQAIRFEKLLVIQSRFESEHAPLNWSLLLVLTPESLETLFSALAEPANE